MYSQKLLVSTLVSKGKKTGFRIVDIIIAATSNILP